MGNDGMNDRIGRGGYRFAARRPTALGARHLQGHPDFGIMAPSRANAQGARGEPRRKETPS